MKSPSLDKIYTTLDKHILLVQSYTEIKELFFIIKACRLKPYDYIFGDRANKLVLWKHWFDEFGNSLEITTNKKVKIVYNDLSLERNRIICTDLYHGLSLEKIAKISKLAYVFHGQDEDLYQECAFVSFLGIDNYLRSYMYLYDEWHSVSSLLLGMKNLSVIGSNRDIKYFREFSNKKNEPIPCISAEQWLTYIPTSQDFQALMRKQCPVVAPLFTKE